MLEQNNIRHFENGRVVELSPEAIAKEKIDHTETLLATQRPKRHSAIIFLEKKIDYYNSLLKKFTNNSR